MNARAYVQAGCASMIPDDALDTAEFPALVTQLIEDTSLRDSMHAAALKQETANAACRLADVVLNAAQC